MKYIKYIIISTFISCNGVKNNSADKDKIKYNDFKEKIYSLIGVMKDSSDSFSSNTAVDIVKIRNSLRIYHIDQKDSILYNDFNSAFKKYGFQRTLSILEMHLSIGMSYYSGKYKLSMGADKSVKSNYFEVDFE